MASSLNLQRNSEVYMSTVDLAGGDTGSDMTPTNTWRIEVLAGYAASQSAATQDITSLESGLTPDRGTQRYGRHFYLILHTQQEQELLQFCSLYGRLM